MRQIEQHVDQKPGSIRGSKAKEKRRKLSEGELGLYTQGALS